VTTMRVSRTLMISAGSLGLFWISAWILSSGVVREPWDASLTILLLYICPIGGLFAALSSVRGDLTSGASRVQLGLGLALSVGFFVYFLFIMTHR